MSDTESTTPDNELERPPCYICRERYTPEDAARHIEPVDCDVCYRCKGKPACYRCGHMYCRCEVHRY